MMFVVLKRKKIEKEKEEKIRLKRKKFEKEKEEKRLY